ncbi:MAG: iron-sulfur cluster assembly accessory protein [Brasilonema angustatum HA4187-MV1]|jgi:iron-sulfur cluster assembly protein|nr:iron-sulfur cluster assembly accessory protein [Brasilonema angustatum HA4187-MV1]
MTVTLTEKAEFRLRTLLQGATSETNTPAKGIRISVKDGGCSGYEYGMEVISQPQPNDFVSQQGHVLVYVDAKSASLLEGLVIDFIEGVMESGFKFINPKATDTCGCGKSFRTADCSSAGTPCN